MALTLGIFKSCRLQQLAISGEEQKLVLCMLTKMDLSQNKTPKLNNTNIMDIAFIFGPIISKIKIVPYKGFA